MHCFYCGVALGAGTGNDENHVRGLILCDECVDARYWWCDTCATFSSHGESCECETCEHCGEYPDECTCNNYSPYVHEYSYKPLPRFHGTGPLFLGPEIEIECPRRGLGDCAEYAAGMLEGLGYLKEDSSISHGFEIVTHPMTFEWALERFPWEMLSKLRRMGCETHSETGLHVHVSRAGFDSPSHVYRWFKLLYRNQADVERIARRSSFRWARFDGRQAQKHTCKGDRRASRYQAINVTNADTFEIRVFQSSLYAKEIQAAFGLAHGSVEYTRGLNSHAVLQDHGWEWSSFAKWAAGIPIYHSLTEMNGAVPCAY